MTPAIGHRMPGQALALLRRSVLLVLLLTIAACSRPIYVGTDGVRPGRQPAQPPTDATGLPLPALTRKLVRSKEAPSTLIADDGTRCTVTAERYAETRVGDRVVCAWQHGQE